MTIPNERIRCRTLRKLLRAARISGRRLHQRRLAQAVGVSGAQMSQWLSGEEPISPQRYRQLVTAIATLVEGEPAPAGQSK